MLTDKGESPLILVVEDDENHAALIRRSFENLTEVYRLRFASTLLEAYKIIDLQLPNLIVADYRLPDGEGSELMLKVNGECPVVLMTSQGSELVAVEAMKSGAQDYIVKSPAAFIHFPETVKYALKSWSLIRSRRLADEAIRRGKREWEQTFDAVPDMIAIIDINHTIVRVNRAMARRCGLNPEHLIGRSCHELVHCSETPPTFCPHIKMLQDGLVHVEEAEIKELGGFFDISVSPLYDSEGRVNASVHVVRDITERKKIEIELKNSALRLNTIFEASSAGILSATPDWKPAFFNKRITDMFGYTAEELKSLSYFQILHPDCYAAAAANMHELDSGQKETVTTERLYMRKDGSTFWGFLSGRSMIDDGGKLLGFLGTITDITERKLADEKRQEMERQFQQTQKLESIGVLAGGIAHDFNNILTIILGHCFMVKKEIDSGLTDKSHIEKIESAAIRAADLCRQMLAYAGRNTLVQSQVNLWQLIDEMVKMLTSAIKKNVSFELDLARDIPEINGDNSQIQQVVMNMIINGAEAIGDANGTIRVALNRAAVQPAEGETDFFGGAIPPGQYACLEVTDSGCGMDGEIQKRIFEPFYTTKFTGRGLGMSATLGIIKSHGGALKLSSTPGIGTCFKIYFPLQNAAVPAEPLLLDHAPSVKGASGTILLVDDEDAIRLVGSALLSAMGFSVLVAANGRDALEIFNTPEIRFDLVLLDLIMPVMGGLETYRKLRKLAPSLPIVICSGYGEENIREEMERDQYTAFIQKPYKPAELIEIFNRIME